VIASLRGQLKAAKDGSIIIEVGGVGYRVYVADSFFDDLPAVGQVVEVQTYMAVRENDITLYGFGSAAELELFRLLIGVNGVGPRSALAALSAFSAEVLRSAIAQGDALALTRIPGIGQKTAQRLVLDLRDKVGIAAEEIGAPTLTGADADVINALTALGYSLAEARGALSAIPDDVAELDGRILAALRALGSS
jgi:Holliday junction DNA helicase RuvA